MVPPGFLSVWPGHSVRGLRPGGCQGSDPSDALRVALDLSPEQHPVRAHMLTLAPSDYVTTWTYT